MVIRIRTVSVVLLLLVSMILVPQAVAKPEYDAALKVVYGINSCAVCHKDPGGGKSMTDYGSKFRAQSGYKRDSVAALRAIGAPSGDKPVQIPIVVKETPGVTNIVEDIATPVATGTVSVTEIKTFDKKGGHEIEEKEEEEKEKDETSEKSPGFGTIGTIGIIVTLSIIYLSKTRRKIK